MNPGLERRLAIPDRVLVQQVDAESVLLDFASEQYFGLNEVGTRIWNHLAEGLVLREIHARLCAEYEVAPEVLEADLLALVDALCAAGLVEAASDPPSDPAETCR